MNRQQAHGLLYIVIMVLVAALVEFSHQLGAGKVPIPDSWEWVVPIATTALISLTVGLEKLVGNDDPPIPPKA